MVFSFPNSAVSTPKSVIYKGEFSLFEVVDFHMSMPVFFLVLMMASSFHLLNDCFDH